MTDLRALHAVLAREVALDPWRAHRLCKLVRGFAVQALGGE